MRREEVLTTIQQRFASALDIHQSGDLQRADTVYRAILADDPAHADSLHLRGVVHHQNGRQTTAIPLIRRALILLPGEPDFWSNLGDALRASSEIESAIGALKRALVLNPSAANAAHNLGLVNAHLGEAEETRRLLDWAVAIDPTRPIFYYTLAREARLTDPDDPRLATMEQLTAHIPETAVADRTNLHLALGIAYKDLGQDDRSLQHFIAGNGLKRQMLGYDEVGTLSSFDRIAAAYPPERFAGLPPVERIGTGPIFIVGMPRSGTSLVEQVLASHSAVFGAGELTLLEQTILRHLPQGASILAVPQLPRDTLLRMGDEYRAALQSRAPGAARIVDKLPLNFMHCGAIALMLPDARVIHMRRDPVDTCLSCFSTHFAGGHSYSLDLGDLGRFYRAYQRMMEHWRRVLPAGIMIDLTYEDVVVDLEGQMRPVFDLCGLEWEEACLHFHRTRRAVVTASQSQVRKPLHKSRTAEWRPSDALLKPLLDALAD